MSCRSPARGRRRLWVTSEEHLGVAFNPAALLALGDARALAAALAAPRPPRPAAGAPPREPAASVVSSSGRAAHAASAPAIAEQLAIRAALTARVPQVRGLGTLSLTRSLCLSLSLPRSGPGDALQRLRKPCCAVRPESSVFLVDVGPEQSRGWSSTVRLPTAEEEEDAHLGHPPVGRNCSQGACATPFTECTHSKSTHPAQTMLF